MWKLGLRGHFSTISASPREVKSFSFIMTAERSARLPAAVLRKRAQQCVCCLAV